MAKQKFPRNNRPCAARRRFVRFPTVRERTGISKTTAWRGMRDSWFPRPVRLSPGCVAWVEDELDAWIEARLAARDRERLP